MVSLLSCTVLVGIASLWSGTNGSTTVDCQDMIDPFRDYKFWNIASRQDCMQKCYEATTFRCMSILYSTERQRCNLSPNVRSEPLPPYGTSDFEYYERPRVCRQTDLTPKIASCDASASYNIHYACQFAYDGGDGSGAASTEWSLPNGPAEDGWMQVNFNQTRLVSLVWIRHRCHHYSQVSGWKLQFQNGDPVEVSRPCGGTASWFDCAGDTNDWFKIELPVEKSTSWVRFVITKACSQISVGIREIKIFGYLD